MSLAVCVNGRRQIIDGLAPAYLAGLGLAAICLEVAEQTQDSLGWELAEYSRQCRRLGLNTFAVPRGYGGVLRGGGVSGFVRVRRDALQLSHRGKFVERACPSNPEFQQWFPARMADLVELLACDAVVWDEPGYYYDRGTWTCRCHYCQRQYEEKLRAPMPPEPTYRVLNFQQESIIVFLLAAVAAVKRINPRCLSIIMHTPGLLHEQLHTDTHYPARLLASNAADALGVHPHWRGLGLGTPHSLGMEDVLREVVRPVLRETRLHRKGLQVWITASLRPEDRMLEAARYALQLGVDQVVLAGFDQVLQRRGGRLELSDEHGEALRKLSG